MAGYVKMWHPKGVQASLELAGSPAEAFAAVEAAFAAGWLANMPGLEPGEDVEPVGGCLKAEQKNKKDGTITPVVYLYSPKAALEYQIFKHYLNTREDALAFEAASGLTLSKMPLYEGDGAPKKPNRLIQTPPREFEVVLGKNPNYDAEEAARLRAQGKSYITPSKLFVRWGKSVAAPPKPAQPQTIEAVMAAIAEYADLSHKSGHEIHDTILNHFDPQKLVSGGIEALQEHQLQQALANLRKKISEYKNADTGGIAF